MVTIILRIMELESYHMLNVCILCVGTYVQGA